MFSKFHEKHTKTKTNKKITKPSDLWKAVKKLFLFAGCTLWWEVLSSHSLECYYTQSAEKSCDNRKPNTETHTLGTLRNVSCVWFYWSWSVQNKHTFLYCFTSVGQIQCGESWHKPVSLYLDMKRLCHFSAGTFLVHIWSTAGWIEYFFLYKNINN